MNGPVQDRMVIAQPDAGEAPKVLALVSDQNRPEPEMRLAFTLNGREWRMRTSAPINISLKYLHLHRTRGFGYARDYMLDALLEPGAYDALMDFDDLTGEQLNELIENALAVMLGRTEPPN